MQHQVNHSDHDHGLTALLKVFVILAVPSIASQPTQCSFNNPSFRQNNKSRHVVGAFNDFKHPAECLLYPNNQFSSITAVCPDQHQPGESVAHLLKHQTCTVPILYVGCMHQNCQHQPQRINYYMAFAALNLFARIVAATPPFSVVFTLWLSTMAALGVDLRPAFLRTALRRLS